MNKKGFTSITLIVVIVAIVVTGMYYVFTKQSTVTQIQQTEPTPTRETHPILDSLDRRSSPLVGKWEVVSVQEGGIQIVSARNDTVIEFLSGGTLKASGGCNEMMPGSYEIQADSKLSISIGGTKRKCAKDIVEFWDLNKVNTYEFTDNFLLLHYKRENGVEGFFKLARLTSDL